MKRDNYLNYRYFGFFTRCSLALERKYFIVSFLSAALRNPLPFTGSPMAVWMGGRRPRNDNDRAQRADSPDLKNLG